MNFFQNLSMRGSSEQNQQTLEEHHFFRSFPFRLSSEQAMLFLAALVGLASGCAASAFYWLLGLFVRIFLQIHPLSLNWKAALIIVLSPAVGGLACGLLLHFFAPDARGGVSEVIDAIFHRDGYIRNRVGVIKTLASAVCIGSGGSAGREGPVVQIGASVGSSLAQFFGVSRKQAQILVACGAGAGIAAVFNAPIAGAFFVAEIITGRFEMGDMTLLFTASAMGATVARILLGNDASFNVPPYHLTNVWELLLQLLLGVACAVVGHLFISTLHESEKAFGRRLNKLPIFAPAIGGLMVGVIGLFVPEVFGAGGDILAKTLVNPVLPGILLLWLVSKMIATSITLGSGGSGGDLMPSLYLGATLGGAYGYAAHWLFPASTMPPGAYALIGATALFAGVAHAPVTGIVLGFEMGRDYGVILPLMVACSVSAIVSKRIRTGSLYTLKLRKKGVDVDRLRGLRSDPLDRVRVSEVMNREISPVDPDLPVHKLLELFQTTGRHGFLVLEKDRLWGIVTLADAQAGLDRPDVEKKVRDIATPNPIVCYPNETLSQAISRLGPHEVGRMPVVSESDPFKVLGVLRRSDVLRGYGLGLERLR